MGFLYTVTVFLVVLGIMVLIHELGHNAMTEALKLKGEEKVLEIGTGSGYQTAVLAELAKMIYSIERLAPLRDKAQKILAQLKYHNTFLRVDDGSRGWPAEAPFDAILVAAGSPQIPEKLKEQLTEGGRLVIPVGGAEDQSLLLITRRGNTFMEKSLGLFRFVDLVGQYGWKHSA